MTDDTFEKVTHEDELIAIKPAHEPYVSITWQVNNFCNYKCKYCNPGNWSGSVSLSSEVYQTDLYKIIENMELIINHYQAKGYKAFKFYFSGGEPTVWPHLVPLITWLKDVIDDPHIGINTNLSRSLNWWKEHHKLFHDIVASFHIDFADKQKFLDNLIFLQDKVNYLCARMMMQEDRFQEVIDYGNHIKTQLQNYALEWVPLYDDISVNVGPWKYSEEWMYDFFKTHSFEHEQKISKPDSTKWNCSSKEIYSSGIHKVLNGNRLTAERRNFFSGWKCFVDESIFINSEGYMTFASCGQGPKVGNIYGKLSLLSEPIICKKHQCTCGTDILITKEKV